MLELSEEIYQRLVELARQQHRTLEDIIHMFLLDYENEQYRPANQQMFMQGILASLPAAQLMTEDDLEPESMPGKSLSEIILEERR